MRAVHRVNVNTELTRKLIFNEGAWHTIDKSLARAGSREIVGVGIAVAVRGDASHCTVVSFCFATKVPFEQQYYEEHASLYFAFYYCTRLLSNLASYHGTMSEGHHTNRFSAAWKRAASRNPLFRRRRGEAGAFEPAEPLLSN